jgi:hypothetical protein
MFSQFQLRHKRSVFAEVDWTKVVGSSLHVLEIMKEMPGKVDGTFINRACEQILFQLMANRERRTFETGIGTPTRPEVMLQSSISEDNSKQPFIANLNSSHWRINPLHWKGDIIDRFHITRSPRPVSKP